MQRAISIFGALALLTATTTVAGAVGNLTGTVTHVHPVSNIVKFNDGRTIYLDPGATFTVDGRQVSMDQIKPGMRVSINGGREAPATVSQSGQMQQSATQQGAMSLPAGHPPVDVSGKVARYDAQGNVITFEDGRMVKLGRGSSVWQQGQPSAIAPGTQVFVRGAEPTGFRSAWNASSMPQHRMGTVVTVDPASALIVMSDGTVVKVSPATKVHSGSDALRLTDLQPGDEVVLVGKPIVASSATNGSGMASPGTQAGARAQSGGSQAIRAGSLPAFYTATFDASEIHIVRKHQAP